MQPSNIHESTVEVTQLDPDATPARHPQLGETRARPRSAAPFQFLAGMRETRAGAFAQRPHGADPRFDGFLVVRLAQLAAQAPGKVLKVGDRITKLYVGTALERAVDLHVVEVRGAGHQNGAPTMVHAFYRDLKSQSKVG